MDIDQSRGVGSLGDDRQIDQIEILLQKSERIGEEFSRSMSLGADPFDGNAVLFSNYYLKLANTKYVCGR